MKKNILLIHTGGTISMSEDVSGNVKPGEINPLTEQEKLFNRLANLIVEEPFNLPSPHIRLEEMVKLKEILERYNQKVDGAVITHGTDTLEETAYFLHLTVKVNFPVVITGAMRSSNEIGSDGLYNLVSSIRVAKSESAREKGVLVVINDEIHSAVNVTKTHTSSVSAFKSLQYGPIGMVTKNDVLFHYIPSHQEYYSHTDPTKQVALIKAHAGMDSSLFFSLRKLKVEGVVIEGLGQGNMPPATLPGIRSLLSDQIPVVLVSRAFNGIVQDTYAYEGGGKQLKDMGVIFSNGLDGPKARIKLLIALSNTNKIDEIKKMFSS